MPTPPPIPKTEQPQIAVHNAPPEVSQPSRGPRSVRLLGVLVVLLGLGCVVLTVMLVRMKRANMALVAAAREALRSPATPAPSSPVTKEAPRNLGKYSTLTGAQWPNLENQIPTMAADKNIINGILIKEKINCTADEEYITTQSDPPFRLINESASEFLDDAKKIGWDLKRIVAYSDFLVYEGHWHGAHRYVSMALLPDRLTMHICRFVPAQTAH